MTTAAKNGPLSLRSLDYWVGGLFHPEAFITATRQCIAQANFWSLEDLALRLSIDGAGDTPESSNEFSFGIKDVKLYGAACKDDRLYISR